jgi:hypothetical protein
MIEFEKQGVLADACNACGRGLYGDKAEVLELKIGQGDNPRQITSVRFCRACRKLLRDKAEVSLSEGKPNKLQSLVDRAKALVLAARETLMDEVYPNDGEIDGALTEALEHVGVARGFMTKWEEEDEMQS